MHFTHWKYSPGDRLTLRATFVHNLSLFSKHYISLSLPNASFYLYEIDCQTVNWTQDPLARDKGLQRLLCTVLPRFDCRDLQWFLRCHLQVILRWTRCWNVRGLLWSFLRKAPAMTWKEEFAMAPAVASARFLRWLRCAILRWFLWWLLWGLLTLLGHDNLRSLLCYFLRWFVRCIRSKNFDDSCGGILQRFLRRVGCRTLQSSFQLILPEFLRWIRFWRIGLWNLRG